MSKIFWRKRLPALLICAIMIFGLLPEITLPASAAGERRQYYASTADGSSGNDLLVYCTMPKTAGNDQNSNVTEIVVTLTDDIPIREGITVNIPSITNPNGRTIKLTIDGNGHRIFRIYSAKFSTKPLFEIGATSQTDTKVPAIEVEFKNITLQNSTDGSPTNVYDASAHLIRLGNGVKLTLGEGTTLENSYFNGNGGFIIRAKEWFPTDASKQVTGLTIAGTANKPVTFRNSEVGGAGGAIFDSLGAPITINNAKFENTKALGTSSHRGLGGAIYSVGDVSVSNTTFSGCSASSSGGAIITFGNITLKDVTIENCSSGEHGGAVYAVNNAYLDGVTITGCSTTGSGGAIFSEKNVHLRNSTFSNNTATNDGGAIRCVSVLAPSGSVTIEDVKVYGNKAGKNGTLGSGGGIWCHRLGGPGQTLAGVAIHANTATQHGGGVYGDIYAGLGNESPDQIRSGDKLKIYYNTAGGDGGGVYSCPQSSNPYEAGGATVYGYIHSNNAGGNGGGIYLLATGDYPRADMDVRFARIEGNTAQSSGGCGGGIYINLDIDGSTPTVRVSESLIKNNTAESSGGGIFDNSTNSNLAISNTTLSVNKAGATTAGQGGGIFKNAKTLTLQDGAIVERNTAGSQGGGVYSSATLSISGASILGNSSTNGSGVYNSNATANSAILSGGVIFGYGTAAADIVFGVTQGDSGAIIAWNKPAGTVKYTVGSDTDLTAFSDNTRPRWVLGGESKCIEYNDGKLIKTLLLPSADQAFVTINKRTITAEDVKMVASEGNVGYIVAGGEYSYGEVPSASKIKIESLPAYTASYSVTYKNGTTPVEISSDMVAGTYGIYLSIQGDTSYEAVTELSLGSFEVKAEGEFRHLQHMAEGSATINHDARLKITQSKETFSGSPYDGNTGSFTVSLPDNWDEDYDVKLKWCALGESPSIGKEEACINFPKGPSGEITLNKENSSETVSYTYDKSAERWNGTKVFYIQFYEPENILFSNNKDTYNLLHYLENNYKWALDIPSASSSSSFPDFRLSGSSFQRIDESRADIPSVGQEYTYQVRADVTFKDGMPWTVGGTYMPYNSNITYKRPTIQPAVVSDDNKDGYKLFDYILGTQEFGENEIINFYIPGTSPFSVTHYYTMKLTVPENAKGDLIFSLRDYSLNSQENPYGTAKPTGELHAAFYLIDSVPPELISLTAPEGTYTPGMIIPITATFSEPCKVAETGSQMEACINGSWLNEAQDKFAFSTKHTFYYTVKAVDNAALSVSEMWASTIHDLKGNIITQEFYNIFVENLGSSCFEPEEQDGEIVQPRSLKNVKLSTARLQDAVLGLRADSTSYAPDATQAVITINLNDTVDPAIYSNDRKDVATDPSSRTLAIRIGETTIVPKYSYNELTERWSLSATFDLPQASTETTHYTAELLYGDGDNKQVQVGRIVRFAHTGQPNVTDDEFTLVMPASWPSGIENLIYTTSQEATKLDYEYTGSNTQEPLFLWESSDDSVAEIDQITGVVSPQATGTVRFKLVCQDNGGAYKETSEIRIESHGPPAIVIPTGMNEINIRQGDAAAVRWATNIIDYNNEISTSGVSQFTIDVFEGKFTLSELEGKAVVHSDTCSITNTGGKTTHYTIPAAVFTKLSVGSDPAYTVRVTAKNPHKPEETLAAAAYIIVSSKPAEVRLEPLKSYYILDNADTVDISWALSNIDQANGAAAEFSVQKGASSVATLMLSEMTEGSEQDYSGSYKLSIDTLTTSSLKDIYTVTLKAKNAADGDWSYDSFVLHVYNHKALDILVDSESKSSATMSNRDWAESSDFVTETGGESVGALTQEEIAQLRRDVNLNAAISANYSDYAWSQFYDVISWRSEDSEIASVNYKQGTLYENIEHFTYSHYLPQTNFMLSGLSDGKVSISATHGATGMTDTVSVEVETLKDSLYLFQFTPMQKTQLSYTNGNSERRSLSTNDDGSIAIYEPSGIASDLVLLSKSANGDVYMGTLRQETLLSGERDSTALMLYPMNYFRLKLAAQADIFIKNENGTPYMGGVTIHGGAYKNGAYIGQINLLVNSIDSGDAESGHEGVSAATKADGRLTIRMSPDELGGANGLLGSDKLEFIFELKFENDAYQPQLAYINGSVNYNESIALGERTLGLIAVEAGAEKKPFLAYQAVDYHLPSGRTESVLNYNGYVGPGSNYPKLTLSSRMLLWGETTESTGYKLSFHDQYGIVPGAATQTSQSFSYPFSTIPIAENVMTLANAAGGGSTLWWNLTNDQRSRAMTMVLSRTDNGSEALLQSISMPWKIIDMGFVEKVNEGGHVEALLTTLNISSAVSGALGDGDIARTVSGIAEKGVSIMANADVDGGIFKMLVSPTQDPTIFTAYLWAGKEGPTFEDKNAGVFMEHEFLDVGSNITPSVKELVQIAKGEVPASKAVLDQVGRIAELLSGSESGNTSMPWHLNGYFEAQIQYNFDSGKWEIYVLGGGFDAGLGIEVNYVLDSATNPLPVTAYVKGSAYLTLKFDAAVRYDESEGAWASSITANKVNDYLTTLRANGYIRAFGGLGKDPGMFAIKIGLFGQVDVDFATKFLSRTYLAAEGGRQTNGQYLEVKGTVGIEATAKLGPIEFSGTLVSVGAGYVHNFNNWTSISNYWAAQSGRPSGNNPLLLSGASSAAAEGGMMLLSDVPRLESRSYLSDYERVWSAQNQPMARVLSIADGPTELQSNAYPFSSPYVSDDGSSMLYISDGDGTDLSNMRIMHSTKNGDTYAEGVAIDNTTPSFGVSGLSIDGEGAGLAATWVRQAASIEKASGDALSADEQALLVSGSEIMAAVYNGSSWVTKKITENGTPDLSPVIATNGSKAVVVWRSVYASDSYKPLVFDYDSILYCVYNGTEWGEAQTLYNGALGSVYALEAEMLPDGSIAIAYALDKPATEGVLAAASNLEIVYAALDASGSVKTNIQVTSNSILDENPQLAAVKFGDEWRFVLGWHSMGEYSDIKLVSFDSSGVMSNSFIESMAQVTASGMASMSGNFRFAKMSGAVNSIENLSIIWHEPATSYLEDVENAPRVDYDLLRAVRFVKHNSGYTISGVMDVAHMNERGASDPQSTAVDHFDAYVGENGASVKAVVLGSEYKADDYRIIDARSGTEISNALTGDDAVYNVYLPKSESLLFIVEESYQNAISIPAVGVDYTGVMPNSLLPLQFTLDNRGKEPVTGVSISFNGGDAENVTDTGFTLLPNESYSFAVNHEIGATVENVEYTITATFAGGDTKTVSDTVHLKIPDVGISKVKTISENEGIREVEVTLYNRSAVPLAGSGQKVRLGIYEDAAYASLMPNITEQDGNAITISDNPSLALIDEGAFTKRLTFNVGAYTTVEGTQFEIPEAGIWLYLNSWIEDKDGKQVAEFYIGNNTSQLGFESLLKRGSGETVTISTQLDNSGGSTEIIVALQNNSLLQKSTGNLVALLLDENGEVLETRQSYNSSAANNGLLSLSGEERSEHSFQFGETGAAVRVLYSDAVLSQSTNANLSMLGFEGIAVDLNDFAASSSVTYSAGFSGELRVTAITEDPKATFTVNGENPVNGVVVIDVPPATSTTITVEATAADGSMTKTYTLIIQNGGGSAIPGENNEPWVNPFTDVSEDDWFYGDVEYVHKNRLMLGTSDTSFAPQLYVSRAMVATVLWRLAGEETPNGVNPFSDLTQKWYLDAVIWAAENEIIEGYGDGKFGPDDNITREQLALMLFRYAEWAGLDVSARTDLGKYSDAEKINSWALDAMRWVNAEGFIVGRSAALIAPDGATTRAELAAVLHRFLDKYDKSL